MLDVNASRAVANTFNKCSLCSLPPFLLYLFSHLLDQDACSIIKAIDKSGTQVRDTRSLAIHHPTPPPEN